MEMMQDILDNNVEVIVTKVNRNEKKEVDIQLIEYAQSIGSIVFTNDANVQEVWYTVLGGTTLVYKIKGNTNFDNGGINYEYDLYFYNDGTQDVFVVQEPTDWNG